MEYDPRIDVKPIREAVKDFLERTESTWSDLCFQLDWTNYSNTRKKVQADTKRLKRALGIDYNYSSHSYTKTIQQKTAIKILDLINRDPSEFGI